VPSGPRPCRTCGKPSSPYGTAAVTGVRRIGSVWAGSARPRSAAGKRGRRSRARGASAPRASGYAATVRLVTTGSVRTIQRAGSRVRSARGGRASSVAGAPPATTTGAGPDGSGPQSGGRRRDSSPPPSACRGHSSMGAERWCTGSPLRPRALGGTRSGSTSSVCDRASPVPRGDCQGRTRA
jgi:hypothetical protein